MKIQIDLTDEDIAEGVRIKLIIDKDRISDYIDESVITNKRIFGFSPTKVIDLVDAVSTTAIEVPEDEEDDNE